MHNLVIGHYRNAPVSLARRPTSALVRSFDHRTRHLRNAISLYAILWLVEGGLRRWVFPGISDALLVVRDPLVLLIYYLAAQQRLLRTSGLEIAAVILVGLSFVATFVVGHQDVFVAVYGARTLLLHLPLMFVIGRSVDARYVQWIAKWTTVIVIPMTALLIVQFYSPETSFVNIGVGGEGTAGFAGALGRFRPPGTFSFITGPIEFYPFATACITISLSMRRARALVIVAAIASVVIACPISISRALVLGTILTSLVAIIALQRLRRISWKTYLKLLVSGPLIVVLLAQGPLLRDGGDAFSSRWQTSTTDQGGVSIALADRTLDNLLNPVLRSLDEPLLGRGLGLGTNAGSKLLVGQVEYLAGESEWERIISEMGPLLGLGFLAIRLGLFLVLVRIAARAWSQNVVAPMLLLSTCASFLIFGQWGQPTILGFTMFVSGLVIASSRIPRQA